MGSEVHLDIYDDRLTVTSPGGMYNGALIQDLRLQMFLPKDAIRYSQNVMATIGLYGEAGRTYTYL